MHVGASDTVSRQIYDESAKKIEHMFRLIDMIVVKVSVFGMMIPPLINSIINYYVYDLQDESFLIPRPMMCVENCFAYIDYYANQ